MSTTLDSNNTPQPDAPTSTQPTSSIREATEHKVDAVIPIGDDLVAYVGEGVTGLYARQFKPVVDSAGRARKNPDGTPMLIEQDPELIVPWVAWRSTARIDEILEKTVYDVTVIRRDMRTYIGRGLDSEESLSPAKVRSHLDAGIPLPKSSAKSMEAIGNMLDMLGHDERMNEITRRFTGWVEIDGHHVFLAPNGSMTALGPDPEITAAMPAGVGDGKKARRLRPVPALTGWPHLPTDIRKAAGTIRGLMSITPNRPEIMIALLGAAFAAPLAADGRAMVVIVGISDSGKSQLAACIQTLLSAAPRSGKHFPVSATTDSTASAMIWARWTRHMLIIADDARTNTEDKNSNSKQAGLVTTLTQAVFGGGAGERATNTGEIRRGAQIESPGLLTAERLSSQAAIRNRSVILEIEKGDIDLGTPGSDRVAAIDKYTEDFHATGLARECFGSYLHFLAKQLDSRGPLAPEDYGDEALDSLTMWAETQRGKHYHRIEGGRSAETAAYIRMGWDAIFAWAESEDILDLMPTAAEVDEAIKKVVSAGVQAATEADPGGRLLDAIAVRLDGGKAHLVGFDQKSPGERVALESGYVWDTRVFQDHRELIPKGGFAGTWTKDFRHIVLAKQGILDAAKDDAILSMYKPEELDTFIRQHCVEDLTPASSDGKVSSKLKPVLNGRRPRGYVITPDKLGLSAVAAAAGGWKDESEDADDDEPETPAAPSTPAKPATKEATVKPAPEAKEPPQLPTREEIAERRQRLQALADHEDLF